MLKKVLSRRFCNFSTMINNFLGANFIVIYQQTNYFICRFQFNKLNYGYQKLIFYLLNNLLVNYINS